MRRSGQRILRLEGIDPATALPSAMGRGDPSARRLPGAFVRALHRAGRSQEALPYAREALRLGTKDAVALYHAGQYAEAADRFREVVEALNR